MEHNLKIRVSKKPTSSDIVSFRNVNIRERFIRFLFGNKQKLTIIMAGDLVEEVEIQKLKEGGKSHEQSKVTI